MDDHFDRVLAQPAAPKRSGDPLQNEESIRNKRRRDAEASESRQKIAKLLAEADTNGVEDLDARALKTMAHALDKAIRKNALQRSKYSDEPSKFMESEVQLNEELTKWKAVAAQPALYPHLVELNVVALLLGLFAHENLDVRLDVINLLADLTDLDEDPGALAPTKKLVEHLVSHDFLPLLVKTLDDLDHEIQKNDNVNKKINTRGGGEAEEDEEEEDAATMGIFHGLQTVENIVDVAPDAAVALGSSTRVFTLLLRLVSHKREFTTNKLYASEILSILVQADHRNRTQFLSTSAKETQLDRLLQSLAPYRKKTPANDEEEEFVENLVNVLCTVLFDPTGQDQFRRLEGLELMLRFMKDRKQYVFTGALRVLDHALMHHPRNCERLIEIGGLKTVFPVFMGKKLAKKKELRAKEVENVTSLMASLCLLVRGSAAQDVFARFHAKFVESDMEKLDRVVDLFATYHDRVQAAATAASARLDEDDDEEDEEQEDERYLRRLDAGLFVLQRVALVVAHLSQFSRKLRAYVMVKFHEKGLDVDHVVSVLHEQVELLIAERDSEAAASAAAAVEPVDAKSTDASASAKDEQIVRLRQLLHAFDEEEEPASSEPKDPNDLTGDSEKERTEKPQVSKEEGEQA